jgi:hypothetical protein
MVGRISYLFQGNVTQYKALVARMQDPAVSLPVLDARVPRVHDDPLTEAERLLHNVLTAMSTRVDQQCRFIEKNFGDDPALTGQYRTAVIRYRTPGRLYPVRWSWPRSGQRPAPYSNLPIIR